MLAGPASGVGLVSESSNSVRSRVKPALHVGEQIGGGVGCRATAGSGGTAGAGTTGGSEGGETVAQPATSISSGISISAGTVEGVVGFIGGFLHLCGAALFFGAGLLAGHTGGFLQGGQLGGVFGLGFGVRGALVGQAAGLHAGGHHRGGQGGCE